MTFRLNQRHPLHACHLPAQSRSRDSRYSTDSRGGGAEEGRENRPPRGQQQQQQQKGQGGAKGGKAAGSPHRGGGGRERERGGGGGRGRKEDGEATVAALKELLQRLHGVNESMPDHQGFLPEELAARVNCPDPALWQEVYTEARIRPNKSNRLYRSRVLYLITYLERRLGLPLSRPPFPPRHQGRDRQGGDRDANANGGGPGRGPPSARHGGERYGEREQRGHGGNGGNRHPYPSAAGSSSSSRRDGRDAQDGRDRRPERESRGEGREEQEEAPLVVEEQMESAEPTPFLAIHNLPRYSLVRALPFFTLPCHLGLRSSFLEFTPTLVRLFFCSFLSPFLEPLS